MPSIPPTYEDNRIADGDDAPPSMNAEPNAPTTPLRPQIAAADQNPVNGRVGFVGWTGHKHGVGTSRHVSPGDWRSVGISTNNTNTAVWHLGNDFRLPASLFSDDQLEHLVNIAGRGDKGGTFELIDADGNPLTR